ncbi:MAG TPA: phosphoglucosamine mutase [Bryobacteraceae bacterium]|nr:phosphoglucosamine mutase [Bryobacteraceae bacterium]
MPRQLFGTDGIRAVAGQAPLDRPTVFAFGCALGEWAAAHAPHGGSPHVVIGTDTRESGQWLAEHVAGGLRRAGVEVRFAGLSTTPGVAYLTKVEDFVAGVMISASHNPYQDNGLKAFDHSGFKLPDDLEHQLEQRIFAILEENVDPIPVALEADETLDNHYIDFLVSTFHGDLDGLRIVLDCANGSASRLGPALFSRLGAEVIATGCSPDGRNINLNCGALHVEALREAVLANHADCGAAFDGDADRCMMVSGSGRILDGDHLMLIAARDLLGRGGFDGVEPAVVATVMSNLGLERALEESGIALRRTAVGDKYVLEEMIRSGLPLGGEQSGHVIHRNYATTGDGMLSALRALGVARRSGSSLDELSAGFTIYPQKLVNVRFKVKRPIEQLPDVQQAIADARTEMGDTGRVLVRFSGTEPLARVMVEAASPEHVEKHTTRIAEAIRAALS